MKTRINTQATLSMRGAGYYSERTAGARDVINNAGPMIQVAIEEIPKDKILRIADFGAADGGAGAEATVGGRADGGRASAWRAIARSFGTTCAVRAVRAVMALFVEYRCLPHVMP